MRRLLAVLCALSILTPRRAVADKKTASSVIDRCIQEAEDAQRERAAGHLLMARTRSGQCVDARCPAAIRHDCDVLNGEVTKLVPTVVFRIRGPGGEDLVNAELRIDAESKPIVIDGHAQEMDPGPHDAVVRADRFATARQHFVVEEGVTARVVEINLAPLHLKVASEPASSRSPAISTWAGSGALAVVGVVGLGLFTGIGLSTDADYRHLESTCKPGCATADHDSIERRFQTADVALTVGLVAVAAAIVVYFLGPRANDAPGASSASR